MHLENVQVCLIGECMVYINHELIFLKQFCQKVMTPSLAVTKLN